jgi:hypothetical protein
VFTDEDFEPDGLFGSRGITPEAVQGDGWQAFFRYEQGDADAVLDADPLIGELGGRAVRTVTDRVARAPGIVMRRFPVPEGKAFILGEMRPEWPIWTGKLPTVHMHNEYTEREREHHVNRRKMKAAAVRKGCTPAEYERIAAKDGFDITGGGDHFGRDTDRLHVHVKIAKYLFQENARETREDPDGPHAHTDYKTAEGLRRHLDSAQHQKERRQSWQERAESIRARGFDPAGLDPGAKYRKLVYVTPQLNDAGRLMYQDGLPAEDEEHPHYITVDSTRYAQRLSIHPWSLKTLDSADRILFCLEGCLKEAAAVVAGEVTFSCPSVSLWDAPELEEFAANHLRGKTVWVVCDSDWERDEDDSVIRMALLARDALRRYGAYAEIAAPPPGRRNCEHKDRKHGVDDHLGLLLCGRGDVDDLIWVDREAGWNLADWLAVNPPQGRKRRWDGVERDNIVLRWIATHAAKNGTTRVALSTVAQNVKGELEDIRRKPMSQAAANKAAERAVRNLIRYGVIEEIEPLRERVRHHLRAEKREWVGKLRVVVPELQARTDTSRRVAEYARRPPRPSPALSEDQIAQLREAVSDPS